jgi:1,4-dihydroxy-2-naphthoyl-CoA hydrolase
MFTYALTVQLHHTDAYGILFFANQFQFCHDVFQAWLAAAGMPMAKSRDRAGFVAVVVHAESDFSRPIELGDQLEARMLAERVGTTSFTHRIVFSNQRAEQVGVARIVQVTIDPKTAQKIPLPQALREALEGNRQ